MEKKKLTEIICLYNAKTKAVVDFVVLTLLLSAVIEFLFLKKNCYRVLLNIIVTMGNVSLNCCSAYNFFCLAVVSSTFSAEIYSGNSCIHCSWGSSEERVRWKGIVCVSTDYPYCFWQCTCVCSPLEQDIFLTKHLQFFACIECSYVW